MYGVFCSSDDALRSVFFFHFKQKNTEKKKIKTTTKNTKLSAIRNGIDRVAIRRPACTAALVEKNPARARFNIRKKSCTYRDVHLNWFFFSRISIVTHPLTEFISYFISPVVYPNLTNIVHV